MLLADEDASVVDGLGESQLEHLGLEATLEEVLDAQAEHVIELHLLLAEHADAHQASQKGIAFEESLRILLLEREQLSGGLSDLRQRELDAPHLSLVAQTELADQFQLLKLWQEFRVLKILSYLVKTFLFERTARYIVDFREDVLDTHHLELPKFGRKLSKGSQYA